MAVPKVLWRKILKTNMQALRGELPGGGKSITDANEEKQLRLALGQVLRYVHQLRAGAREVVPVIVAEREPGDPSWPALCAHLGVRLTWPGAFDVAVRPHSSTSSPS